MPKKFYWVIDFFLIVIVLFLLMKNYDEWIRPKPEGKGAVASKPKLATPPIPVPAAKKGEGLGPAVFKMISEKNLFSPDRKEFPVLAGPDAKDARKPMVRPNLTLYGVVIGNQFGSAMISNPTRKDKERDTLTVRVGDKVGEFTVARILEDRITLESSEDSFDVLLYDASKPKKRVVPLPLTPAPVRPSGPAPGMRPASGPSPGGIPTPSPSPGIGASGPIPPGKEVPGRASLRQRLQQRRLESQPGGGVTPGSPAPLLRGVPGGTKEEASEGR